MKSFMMGSSAGTAVYYCCISNGSKKVHSYNSGDHELESLADRCLENAPPFHAWYFHTVGRRTCGFLMEDGYTYFVIADATLGKPDILRFLQYVGDGFKKSMKNGHQEELIPVIRQLITTLENIPRPAYADLMTDGPSPNDTTTLSKVPLLGRSNSKHDRKKLKDRAADARGSGDNEWGVNVSLAPETLRSFSLQNGSFSPLNQLTARRQWLRQVKIVIIVDVIVCLILFGIWLGVCQGLKCVSSRK